jgi:hypothetical protein
MVSTQYDPKVVFQRAKEHGFFDDAQSDPSESVQIHQMR